MISPLIFQSDTIIPPRHHPSVTFCTRLSAVAPQELVSEAVTKRGGDETAAVGGIMRDLRACLEMHCNAELHKAAGEAGDLTQEGTAMVRGALQHVPYCFATCLPCKQCVRN